MSSVPGALKAFLSAHYVENSKDAARPVTNTRIACPAQNIGGGKYHIPRNDYMEFLRIYYHEVFVCGNAEYLTEVQMQCGPLAVDFDFRYSFEVEERIHTDVHVDRVVNLYLEELIQVFEMNEGTAIDVFVMHKPNVNRIVEKNITKDGIHLFFGITVDRTTQMILRNRVLQRLPEIWADLPLQNAWEDVLDDAVTSGSSNWQLLGSKKPGFEAYVLTSARRYIATPDDTEETMEPENLPFQTDAEMAALFPRLSVRCRHYPKLHFTPEFADIWRTETACPDDVDVYSAAYNDDDTAAVTVRRNGGGGGASTGIASRKRARVIAGLAGNDDGGDGGDDNGGGGGVLGVLETSFGFHFDNRLVLRVHNAAELEEMFNAFKEGIPSQEHELVDICEYTMVLPAKYYDTYTEWIRVGWALRNIHSCLFLLWMAFSAQSTKFAFADIHDYYEEWKKMVCDPMSGLTHRSIMHWAKLDANEQYLHIRDSSLSFVIHNTVTSIVSSSAIIGCKSMRCTDNTLARVLHHMFKDEFVCASVRGNAWFRFVNHRWKIDDSGSSLRRAISEQLRAEYARFVEEMDMKLQPLYALDELTEEQKALERALIAKKKCATEIKCFLENARDKDNIMKEARELFYNSEFVRKLDTNRYLLCFNNGVVDFKTKEFRRGYPEDYVSKTTGIDYVALAPDTNSEHARVIAELNDFMQKLFPIHALEVYMWQHLASVLIGTSGNQTFNMYVGVGQNGKSVLVNLMEHCLGEYKANVPLTVITQQRTKVGGLSPELVSLKGARYAVIQEPSKGDRINEGIMKELTSGIDKITCRAPYMPEMVVFEPQFKLVVCSNELMEIKSNDHGTWRRIRVVDFLSLFTEQPVQGDTDKPYQFLIDKNIMEKFAVWKEIFMSMLVNIAFESNGLVEDCDMVLQSSHKYRQSQDFMALYVEERIVVDACGQISIKELNEDFRDWYSKMYGRACSANARELHEYIEKHCRKMTKSGKFKGWNGIAIRRDNLVDDDDGGGGGADVAAAYAAGGDVALLA